MKTHLIFILSTLLFAIAVNGQSYGTYKDAVNNHNYKTVKIGKYEWMEENLDATRFRNGDIIPEAKTKEEFIKAFLDKKPVWCYAFTNEKVRSKLYNYWASMDPRGLAPKGWHIPNDDEVGELSSYYDRLDVAFHDSAIKSYNDSMNVIVERKKIAKKISDSIQLAKKALESDTSVLDTDEIVLTREVIEDDVDLLEEKPLIPSRSTNAGIKLRTVGWGEGTNESGFNALPISGITVVGSLQAGKVVNVNAQNLNVAYDVKGIFPSTLWWLKNDAKETDKRYFYIKINSLYPSNTSAKNVIQYALPVRCIRD
jgi:uncharacterized protein (TIGR02145 family)